MSEERTKASLEQQIDHNAIILKAFNIFGTSVSEALLYQLETGYGIRIKQGGPAISIQKLEGIVVKILGAGGAVLMDQIRAELNSDMV